MSTAVPPAPQEVAPGLSEPQRIINTYIAPSKTFEDIRRNASWWVPWLIVAIFATGVQLLALRKLDFQQIMREEIANSSRAQLFESLPKEQQEQQLAFGMKFVKIIVYAWPFLLLIGGIIAAGVLTPTFNFIFGAEVPFSRGLAVVFYSWLPGIITYILTMIVLMVGTNLEGAHPRNMVATNLAYFLDRHTTPRILYGLAGSLNVISIWRISLIAIGLKLNSLKPKFSTGAAVIAVAVWYLIWRLVASVLGWV